MKPVGLPQSSEIVSYFQHFSILYLCMFFFLRLLNPLKTGKFLVEAKSILWETDTIHNSQGDILNTTQGVHSARDLSAPKSDVFHSKELTNSVRDELSYASREVVSAGKILRARK